MNRKTLVEIIAMIFVILFLYTGISKLMDYSIFKEQIGLSPLLSPIKSWVAILLPTIEIIVAILLFVPTLRMLGLYFAFGLMFLFTVYITYILNFNPELPCTCGGILEILSWKQHLFLNCILVILALAGIIISRGKKESLIKPIYRTENDRVSY